MAVDSQDADEAGQNALRARSGMDGHENNVAVVKAAAELHRQLRVCADVFSILDGSQLVPDEAVDKIAEDLCAAGDFLNVAIETREDLLRAANAS